jgi:hypothetical protein
MGRCRFAPGVALLLAVAVTLSGCASAKAEVALPTTAPLVIPPPPARVVVPPAPEPPPAAVDPAPPAGSAATVTNPSAVSTGRPTRDPRPITTPPAPPPPNTTTPATPASPPSPLETQANQSDLERRARDLIASATGTLDKIDYRALSADGKGQYDTARRFIEQAAAALKTKNVVYGWQLADKANTIATLLQRR